MSNIGEYQTKESQRRIRWKLCVTISYQKKSPTREKGLSSLPEGKWAVAESQRGMTQDKEKLMSQNAMPWKTGIFLRERVELFNSGWTSWFPKVDDTVKCMDIVWEIFIQENND